jgi:hypothetical protein
LLRRGIVVIVVAVVFDALAYQLLVFGLESGDDAGSGLIFELGRCDTIDCEWLDVCFGGFVIRECYAVARIASDEGGLENGGGRWWTW